MAQETTRVSVIGVGNLGTTLATALLEAGCSLAVWNRSPGRTALHVEAGALAPERLEDALEHADVVVFALPDYAAVDALFAGPIAAGRLSGRIVLNMGTGDAAQARRAHEQFTSGGALYLEGDCGSYPSAIGTDESACIYSGPRELFDRLKDAVIMPFGRDGAWIGEDIGAANSLFMATSGFFMTSLAAYFEGAAHASRHDIGVEAYTDFSIKYLDTLRDLFTSSLPLLKSRDHSSIGQAALELYVHATTTIREDAESVGARTDLLATGLSYFEEALDAGHGADEVSVLFETLLDHDQQPAV